MTTTRESNSQNVWYGWVVEFDNFLDTTKMAKTLEITRGFYQSSMKSDIFGKVDFGVPQVQDVNQDTKKATVPF